jgi:hypothetical protein
MMLMLDLCRLMRLRNTRGRQVRDGRDLALLRLPR